MEEWVVAVAKEAPRKASLFFTQSKLLWKISIMAKLLR
jgi:hypothetical protein